jgi:hydrogenase maturation factor
MRLPLGKLPADLLARVLRRLPAGDPRVIVPAQPGVDAAAIDFGGRVLIATSDPITFPTHDIAWYALHVNANDIAVLGGEPRWFLATVLLPEGTEEQAVESLFRNLAGHCERLGVTLIGGHTEVTYGIDRPIVAGTMLGEAAPGELISSAGARPGDRLLVTGGIAIEGTAILATEARDALRAAGIAETVLARAARLLYDPGISVLPAARALRQAVPVHALHDATEGGLATAIREMAEASRVGVSVTYEGIPVLPETRLICPALGLDPLGLLASGCLIAAVAPEDVDRALAALGQAGVAAWPVGEALAVDDGLRLVENGRHRPLPAFPRDELARWLAESRPPGPPS